MDKPRIFLGSSGKQEKLLKTLERGLDAVANVVPWTTSFNPGTTTLERLVELAHDVDFAAFAFARDDWTTVNTSAPAEGSGQASPRDNVVFEAGLFGGVLGMRRTFILHASGSKLPTDLLGLTSIRYGDETACGDARRQPEAPQGDRNRGAPRQCRRFLVAVLPDRAEPARAFRPEPAPHHARPRRRARAARPFLAGGRPAVGKILERSGEGEESAVGPLLLLAGRAAPRRQRAAAGRDRRIPARVRPTAPPAISRRMPTVGSPHRRERPAFTCVPIQRMSELSMPSMAKSASG